MSAETIAVRGSYTEPERTSALLVGKLVAQAQDAAVRIAARWTSQDVVAPQTDFDTQFAVTRSLITPDFPEGIQYAFARPDESTGKSLVGVVSGVHGTPSHAKEFMRMRVEDGHSAFVIFNFPRKKNLLEKDGKLAVLTQKGLANYQVAEHLLKAEEIDQIDIFGHSMGGPVGTYTAQRLGSRGTSFVGYASAGALGDINRWEYVQSSLQNRTVKETLYSLRHTVANPMQTWDESGGTVVVDFPTRIGVLNDMGIETVAVWGEEDPLAHPDRTLVYMASAPKEFQPKHTFVVPGRHSDVFERPQLHEPTIQEIFRITSGSRVGS